MPTKSVESGPKRAAAPARSKGVAASGESAATRPAVRERRARARAIARLLARDYPKTGTALEYDSPFQLYVATVLSAQSTDELVNRVTPELFRRYPDAAALSRARRDSIEKLVRATGFFRNKSKSIHQGARAIVERFGSELPATMEALVTIPGVGRKTANVILGNAFGVPGITVDRHVQRVSRRLGLTDPIDPVKIEFELRALLPPREWTAFSHRLIQHGRRVCVARRPRCPLCALLRHCPHGRAALETEG